jgi:hypothetical protein
MDGILFKLEAQQQLHILILAHTMKTQRILHSGQQEAVEIFSILHLVLMAAILAVQLTM